MRHPLVFCLLPILVVHNDLFFSLVVKKFLIEYSHKGIRVVSNILLDFILRVTKFLHNHLHNFLIELWLSMLFNPSIDLCNFLFLQRYIIWKCWESAAWNSWESRDCRVIWDSRRISLNIALLGGYNTTVLFTVLIIPVELGLRLLILPGWGLVCLASGFSNLHTGFFVFQAIRYLLGT